MFFKIRRWLDLNHGPLVSEATALPPEPQLLDFIGNVIEHFDFCLTALKSQTKKEDQLKMFSNASRRS